MSDRPATKAEAYARYLEHPDVIPNEDSAIITVEQMENKACTSLT